eukprot:365602-Chlamydomonas_euryale.AAC.14
MPLAFDLASAGPAVWMHAACVAMPACTSPACSCDCTGWPEARDPGDATRARVETHCASSDDGSCGASCRAASHPLSARCPASSSAPSVFSCSRRTCAWDASHASSCWPSGHNARRGARSHAVTSAAKTGDAARSAAAWPTTTRWRLARVSATLRRHASRRNALAWVAVVASTTTCFSAPWNESIVATCTAAASARWRPPRASPHASGSEPAASGACGAWPAPASSCEMAST